MIRLAALLIVLLGGTVLASGVVFLLSERLWWRFERMQFGSTVQLSVFGMRLSREPGRNLMRVAFREHLQAVLQVADVEALRMRQGRFGRGNGHREVPGEAQQVGAMGEAERRSRGQPEFLERPQRASDKLCRLCQAPFGDQSTHSAETRPRRHLRRWILLEDCFEPADARRSKCRRKADRERGAGRQEGCSQQRLGMRVRIAEQVQRLLRERDLSIHVGVDL